MKKNLLLSLLSLACLTVTAKSSDKINYPKHFPEYSWDKVSVYAHVGSDMDFTDEQYSVLSQFPIVCINGSTGKKQYEGSDKGVAIVAEKFKALNPKLTLLCYLSFNTDYSSRYTTGRVITAEKNAHWALKDQNGKSVTTSKSTPRFDKTLPEVRKYMLETIDQWSSQKNIDGIFMDSYTTLTESKQASLAKKLGDKKAKEFLAGETILRNQIKEKISSNRIVIGNGVSAKYKETKNDMDWLETVSGGMMDHFGFNNAKNEEDLAAAIEHIQELGKAGKMVMVKAWPEFHHKSKGYNKKEVDKLLKGARETITFPLACFLCGAQKYAYFCYSWAWGIEAGAVMYDEYQKPLGEPKGDYTRKGWEFSREFAHASVWVNVQTQEAKIDWKK